VHDAATPSPILLPNPGGILKVLSLNIQVAHQTTAYRHYVTQAWKHVLPARNMHANLDNIAALIADYDVVALQEADAGSFRTRQVNQVAYLAERAGFPHWHAAVNRNLGFLGQHCLGVLSRVPLSIIDHHRLPGMIPGRGALQLELQAAGAKSVNLIVAHLALSRATRARQIAHLSDLACAHPRTLIVGDLNCDHAELHAHSGYCNAGLRILHESPTWPSWRPSRSIDHALATPGLVTREARVLSERLSDHLPLATEIVLDIEPLP